MSISPVQSGTVEYPSGSENTNFTLTLPAAVLPGDIIIFNVTTNVEGLSSGLSTSSGATALLPLSSTSGAGVSGAVYWYQVPATKPASVTFTWSVARRGSLAWFAFRSNSGGSLSVDVSNYGAWLTSSAQTHTIPSLTTTAPNTLLIAGLMIGSGSSTSGIPADWTMRTDATQREGTIISKPQAPSGATGTASFDTSSSGSYQSRVWALAVKETGGTPPLSITGSVSTDVFPSFTGDIADGASIVYDNTNPANSVVIGTNKDVGGGLYVFNLSGDILSSRLDGAANSVDWRDTTGMGGDWNNRIIVMTTDRDNDLLRFYWLDRSTKALSPAGTASLGWEPYGTCLYLHSDSTLHAFVTQRGPDDTSPRNMYQYPLNVSGDTVSVGSAERTFNLNSVVEGLAADDPTEQLFASEEDVGLYRYSADPTAPTTRVAVDTVGAGNLIADVEDVAIARSQNGSWLLVSSQGDSTYHTYDLVTLAHVKKFIVYRPGGTNQVTSTDGLDVYLGYFSPEFPNGLVVVHDGDQTPTSDFVFADPTAVFGELAPADPKLYAGAEPVDNVKIGLLDVDALYVGDELIWQSSATPIYIRETTVTETFTQGGLSSINVNLPASSAVEGELCVVLARHQGAFAGDISTTTSGWTAGHTYGDTTGVRGMAMFYKVVGAGGLDSTMTLTRGSTGRWAIQAFLVSGVDPNSPVVGTGAHTSSSTLAVANIDTAGHEVFFAGAEGTAGKAIVPMTTTAAYATKIKDTITSTDTATSRTGLASWYRKVAPTQTPGGTVSPSDYDSMGTVSVVLRPKVSDPIVDGVTVAELLSTDGFTIAHRGGSRDWPEFSVAAYQNSISAGYKAFEVSLARTSDGVWFGLHDEDINRISGTTGLPAASQMTWSQVQQYQINPPASNSAFPAQPFATLSEILSALDGFVVFIDYKYAWQFKEELLDVMDINGGPTRFIGKQFITDTDWFTKCSARGYQSWGFAYETDLVRTDWSTLSAAPTLLGMDYSASESAWTTTKAVGKPIIGHIAPSLTAYNTARAYGAVGVMCSGVRAIPAVG